MKQTPTNWSGDHKGAHKLLATQPSETTEVKKKQELSAVLKGVQAANLLNIYNYEQLHNGDEDNDKGDGI